MFPSFGRSRSVEAKNPEMEARLERFRSLPPGYPLTLPAAQHLAGGSEHLRAMMDEGFIRKQRGGKFSFVPPWSTSSGEAAPSGSTESSSR